MEMFVAIGIIAVVMVAVVLTLNPAELMRQARDARRVSELKAIGTGMTALSGSSSTMELGASSTLYVSLPDADPACGSWALPALPSPWQYRCAPEATYRKLDGTGWIPLDVAGIARYVSVSALPVDPANDATRYYAYAASSTAWEVSAPLESRKLGSGGSTDFSGRDGGDDPARYEVGKSLTLQP